MVHNDGWIYTERDGVEGWWPKTDIEPLEPAEVDAADGRGSVHDYDALAEVYDKLTQDYLDPRHAPMWLVDRLTSLALRCGWDGGENAVAWTQRRVAAFRRAAQGGF